MMRCDGKIIRSLTFKFEYVLKAIEDSKYMSAISIKKPRGSPQAHEQRMNQNLNNDDKLEKACRESLQSKLLVKEDNQDTSRDRGHRGRAAYHGGRGIGTFEKR